MKKFQFELPSWKLLPKIRLPKVVLPKIVLPKLWKLPRRVLLRERILRERMLPQVSMPRIRVDFPEEVLVPWDQMEIERIEVVPLKPRDLKIIFRRIPADESQLKHATP